MPHALRTPRRPPVRSPNDRRFPVALAVLGALACDHSPPFSHRGEDADGPFDTEAPVQLTFNIEEDLFPQWIPGDTGILYAVRFGAAQQRDRCLAVIPPAGGQRRELCKRSFGGRDSAERLGPASLSPDGRIAYEYHQRPSRGQSTGPDRFVVAPLSDPFETTTIHPLPFLLSGISIDAVRDPRWLDARRLVYVALRLAPTPGAPTPDGRAVVLADLSVSPPRLEVLPHTTAVSSLDVAENGDLVTTVMGDSRVYRGAPGAPPDVIFDFAPAGIARDASIRGPLVSAVVGGGVQFLEDPFIGPRQSDIGGSLMVADVDRQQIVFSSPPGAVRPSPVPFQSLFRRPALGPGRALVFEAYPYDVIVVGEPPNTQVDTVIAGTSDLWTIQIP